MKKIDTIFLDAKLITPDFFEDNRGWFIESFNAEKFSLLGLNDVYVQDNHSFSKSIGTIRGLHFQNEPKPQAKLVRCTKGEIWDVIVDLRVGSPTYLKWQGFVLNDQNKHMLYIPKGFAHGFITLSENSEVQYKVDNTYDPKLDRSIRFDDPQIEVQWPIDPIEFSNKDLSAPNLSESDVNFIYQGEQ